MANWTDHGSPMSLATFSWASANAWAGHTIFRNGRLYWYVPVTNRATGRMAIGVAVADSPTGPFRDALGRPLVENGEIDPHAFVDDNGQGYLYWGNPNLWYVRLNADMVSYAGGPTQIPAHHRGVRYPHREREPADAVRGRAVGVQAQRPVLQRVRGRVLFGAWPSAPRPAGKHLENIYAKLGVANRASLIDAVHR